MVARNVDENRECRSSALLCEQGPVVETRDVIGVEHHRRSAAEDRLDGSCLPYHRGLKDQIGQEGRYCLADGYRIAGPRAIPPPAQKIDL